MANKLGYWEKRKLNKKLKRSRAEIKKKKTYFEKRKAKLEQKEYEEMRLKLAKNIVEIQTYGIEIKNDDDTDMTYKDMSVMDIEELLGILEEATNVLQREVNDDTT